MPPPGALVIRRIRPDDDITQFTLTGPENRPLRHFLRTRAQQYDANSLGRTYVLVDGDSATAPGRVWGYITLVASQTETTEGNRPENVDWPSKFQLPGVKLARMAMDDELRGQGIGRASMEWVIAHLRDNVCQHIGCRLLITDAKKHAVGFYQKLGFHILDTEQNKAADEPIMFIDLLKL